MDLRPWNYWTRDGVPYRRRRTEVQAVARAGAGRNKNHPGALHLWIHLWEATDTPERAEAEADRLLPLMPGAGHIVHMPAHIYQRVGRHADVIRSNQLAAKADEDYIAQCRAQGMYPLAYYPHNLHFIWMGATRERPAAAGARVGEEAGRRHPAGSARHGADPPGLPRGAVLGDGPLRRMGRDPRRQGAAATRRRSRAARGATRGRWPSSPGTSSTRPKRELEQLTALVADPGAEEARRRSRTTPVSRSCGSRRKSSPARSRAKRKDWDTARPAPRPRRPLRGRADLPGAGRLACAGAAEPRRRAARQPDGRTKPRRSSGRT